MAAAAARRGAPASSRRCDIASRRRWSAVASGRARCCRWRRCARCGAALGRVVYTRRRLPPPHRAREPRARLSRRDRVAERRALARGMFAHFGSAAVRAAEVRHAVATTRCWRPSRSRATSASGRRYEQGSGVLFFTGHFGYWEMQAHRARRCACSRSSVLARPLDNPRCTTCSNGSARAPATASSTGRARSGKVLRDLAANRGVAILIDQHLHTPDAVYVDFFSRPAATTSALAALALRTGAPVMPVFALPLPGGRYRLIYEHARRSAARRTRPTPSASSRSAAPTCSRCTSGAIRSCGSGCTGAGATRSGTGRHDLAWRRAEADCLSPDRRVLVVAPNWLGDAVMALPAIADVRRHFHAARLTVAARRRVAPLFALVAGVDEDRDAGWSGSLIDRRRLSDDVERLRAGRSTWRCCCRTRSRRPGWSRAPASPSGGATRPTCAAAADAGRAAAAGQHASGGLLPAPHSGARDADAVRSSRPSTVPAAGVEAARTLLATRGWDGSRPLWSSRPARPTARRSGGCRATSPRWSRALVQRDGTHVRARRQRGDARHDASWSLESIGAGRRARPLSTWPAPRRCRRWPAF